MFSYIPDYKFNFVINQIPGNSCLNGFRETFAKSLAQAQVTAQQIKKRRPKRNKDKKGNNSSLQLQNAINRPSTSFSFSDEIKKIQDKQQSGDNFVITLNTNTSDRSVTSSNNQSTDAKSPFNEDSNYSFTEFFDDKLSSSAPQLSESTKLVPTSDYAFNLTIPDLNNFSGSSAESAAPRDSINPFAEKMPDYIALEEIVEEKNQDAKVMLTKNHFKILECEAGKMFLEQAKTGFQLVIEFAEDSYGITLMLKGPTTCQTKFHVELKNYLYKIEMGEYEKQCEQSRMVPKDKDKVRDFERFLKRFNYI